jgi:hypothetical protein
VNWTASSTPPSFCAVRTPPQPHSIPSSCSCCRMRQRSQQAREPCQRHRWVGYVAGSRATSAHCAITVGICHPCVHASLAGCVCYRGGLPPKAQPATPVEAPLAAPPLGSARSRRPSGLTQVNRSERHVVWPWTHEIPCCVHLLVTWQGPTATAAAPCLAKDLLLLHAVGAGAPVVDPVGTEVLSPPPLPVGPRQGAHAQHSTHPVWTHTTLITYIPMTLYLLRCL